MAIYHVKGNLLKSDCNIICHQANCFNMMMAGIAKQISFRYPEAFEADRMFGTPDYRFGKASYAHIKSKNLLVFNLYGQYRYGRGLQTDYEALRQAIYYMFVTLKEKSHLFLGNTPLKIGMPFGLGCGLAGGDWSIVYSIIEQQANAFGFDVYLYEL